MAELRFANGDLDRRRRMLASDLLPPEESLTVAEGCSGDNTSGAAFRLLSRDQMICRLISPRIWKHSVLVSMLLLLPITLLTHHLFFSSSRETTATFDVAQGAALQQGLAGLEIFVAAQLCLLICWVRAGSAVDFKGGYRTWRWMSAFLCACSFLLLTGAAPVIADLIAALLKPVLGTIHSARPALFFVPAGAAAAFILRYLIPDMGRCRIAQSLAVAAIGATFLRLFLGMHGEILSDVNLLPSLNLLICGLVFSATLLHCRYVIHVNPNPPVIRTAQPRPVDMPDSNTNKTTHPQQPAQGKQSSVAPKPIVLKATACDSSPSATPMDSSETPPGTAAVEEEEESKAASKNSIKPKASRKQTRKAG